LKTFKSFIFIIFFFSLSNTFVFASIPPLHVGYLNKNANTKVNSSTLNFGTDTAYSSEKVLATIGQGTITVKDTENSDELTGLNRDINNINKYLYSGGTEISIPIFNYNAIINGITNGFSYLSGEKNLLEDILHPNTLDIEKYRLKNNMKNNILKK
jgi:hypothetical protein